MQIKKKKKCFNIERKSVERKREGGEEKDSRRGGYEERKETEQRECRASRESKLCPASTVAMIQLFENRNKVFRPRLPLSDTSSPPYSSDRIEILPRREERVSDRSSSRDDFITHREKDGGGKKNTPNTNSLLSRAVYFRNRVYIGISSRAPRIFSFYTHARKFTVITSGVQSQQDISDGVVSACALVLYALHPASRETAAVDQSRKLSCSELLLYIRPATLRAVSR